MIATRVDIKDMIIMAAKRTADSTAFAGRPSLLSGKTRAEVVRGVSPRPKARLPAPTKISQVANIQFDLGRGMGTSWTSTSRRSRETEGRVPR